MIQVDPLCCIRKHTCLLRRTASNRVNFNMSAKRDAASFSWYVRNERISEGIAIAVKMSNTARETINSTMLKPAMRLQRVREMGALLDTIVNLIRTRNLRSSL
jgi:hypothetical protein